jgi:hypothetical protein
MRTDILPFQSGLFRPEIGLTQNRLMSFFMPGFFWWIRQIILILMGGFFLLFGIYLLIAAYHLEEPFSFIMTFFASNLIILISATLLVGFVWRLSSSIKSRKPSDKE